MKWYFSDSWFQSDQSLINAPAIHDIPVRVQSCTCAHILYCTLHSRRLPVYIKLNPHKMFTYSIIHRLYASSVGALTHQSVFAESQHFSQDAALRLHLSQPQSTVANWQSLHNLLEVKLKLIGDRNLFALSPLYRNLPLKRPPLVVQFLKNSAEFLGATVTGRQSLMLAVELQRRARVLHWVVRRRLDSLVWNTWQEDATAAATCARPPPSLYE